jgi:hypothetical protein
VLAAAAAASAMEYSGSSSDDDPDSHLDDMVVDFPSSDEGEEEGETEEQEQEDRKAVSQTGRGALTASLSPGPLVGPVELTRGSIDALADRSTWQKYTVSTAGKQDWQDLWERLKQAGWRKKPTGLVDPPHFFYPPGVESGRRRVDYFDSKRGVYLHLSGLSGQTGFTCTYQHLSGQTGAGKTPGKQTEDTAVTVGQMVEVEFEDEHGIAAFYVGRVVELLDKGRFVVFFLGDGEEYELDPSQHAFKVLAASDTDQELPVDVSDCATSHTFRRGPTPSVQTTAFEKDMRLRCPVLSHHIPPRCSNFPPSALAQIFKGRELILLLGLQCDPKTKTLNLAGRLHKQLNLVESQSDVHLESQDLSLPAYLDLARTKHQVAAPGSHAAVMNGLRLAAPSPEQ